MADANELYQTIIQELSNVVISDSGDFKEEQDEFTFHQETDSDDFPPSLLSYFETSKSRAADCEKFILEGPQDLTASHHTEDVINLPYNLDENVLKLNMQVTCETENEENVSSADTHLLPAPTETEALSAHNVPACSSSNDDAGADEYMGCEEYSEFEERTLKSSMKEEEMKKNSEHQREQQCEEMMKEEQRRQRERDFQEELRKIMETEELQQKELELMQKKAQEKLEQEFLLQQEMISSLQKRVEEERKRREEEQKRIKEEGERKRKEGEEKRKREEEEKRKREEEMIEREMERKRKEEEEKRKREEEREEEMIEREMERKRKEDEEKRKREEEKRKKEEEMIKREMERKMKEEEEKRKREEEMMKREMEQKRKEEEEKGKREEEMIKREMERKKLEENRKMKEEQEKRKEEMRLKEKRKKKEEKMRMEEDENKKREEDTKKREEERKKKEIRLKEETRQQMEEEERKGKENEEKAREMERNREREEEKEGTRKKTEEKQMIELTGKKMERDERGENEEEMGLKAEGADNDDKDRRREEEERTEQEDMKCKEEERKREEETRKVEIEKKRKKEEHRGVEENKSKDEEEKIKQHEERRHGREGKDMLRKKEENKIKEGEMGKKKEEGGECSDMEKEKKPRKEREWNKAHETENRKMERERETKDEENKQEEVKKTEDVRKIKEKVRTEERRLRQGEEERHKIIVQDTEEEEERVMRANELHKRKRENEMKTQNENKNIETSRNSPRSPPEDGSMLTSPSPGPVHSGSTAGSTCSDLNQTSTCETVLQQHEAVQHYAASSSLPVCLPERTEQKRLSWMKDCVPWSKLSLQNRRKQKRGVRSGRGVRRAAEARGLPPLCPHTLLQSTGCTFLQEVTTVTLEDLPGCSLSTLAQCPHLQALTLRRCGLKSLEGIKHLAQLCYIDVQENNISFVDCENMTSLQVLLLSCNKLTSIHGLTGAENLDLLDLSHNSITRIAGLESMKRLQRLSVDHNQLISTKGLRDVYTLLYLDCSHNHLVSVEGLENSALLQTLDLRANSLTEPPTLNNHILLRELHLDDNSISSLQSLAGCWLPLLHHLSVAQNRITLLPSMADFVSLANLDLQFNCISELQNVCESLEGCRFIREVHLAGNPVQQESGWSSTLQQAVAGLRGSDGQETDAFMSAPAVPRVSSASGGFLAFCQAQLKQTCDLQQQHSRELSNASSHLDAVKSSCRHVAETLKLAVDQRFAHEYGDTTESAGRTAPEETLDGDSNNGEEHSARESVENVAPVTVDEWTSEEKSSTEDLHDTDAATTTATPPVFKHQDLDPKNTAAVVIQQWWRKYRQKCGSVSSPPAAERGGGDEGKPEPGPSCVNNRAATIIQAFWRGFALRRRLASALAAVTCPNSGEEDETFEEVDVDEFVLDEAALDKHWTLDSPSRLGHSRSEEPLSLKPLEPFPESSECTLPPLSVWSTKQAWVMGEPVDCTGQRVSPESSSRKNSPASSSLLSGLSARSEKILEEWGFTDSHTAQLMLKRAQKMKSKKQEQKKFRDPSVRLALFRNCSYQRGPVEARNRPAPQSRYHIKVSEAEPGLRQDEETEHVTQQGRAQQWLHDQTDRDSESERFLPEISSDILNGGRVQLVADPGYTERLHHASGSWANSNLAALPCKERNYPRRNSLGHAREEERPPPNRVTSAPLKKERISFRDNPVQLSGGWGGGKKRDRVYK